MMEKKEEKIIIKSDQKSMGNSTFTDPMMMMMMMNGSFSLFDTPCELVGTDYKDGSLGLMDLLGIGGQDYNPSLFDLFQTPSIHQHPPPLPQQIHSPASSTVPESSEVLNTPATPNSCSISSSSNEDQQNSGKQAEEEEAQQGQDKTKNKQLKPKKKNQKRQREPRFAFMTKSEVDHLDDGFRWRKYGQKAVKNSPFPRSYYRCTTASCGVKKRVERSCEDQTIVVTTYEGQHTHQSPVMPRGSNIGLIMPDSCFGHGGGSAAPSSSIAVPQPHYHYVQQQQQQQHPYDIYNTLSPSLNFSSSSTNNHNSSFPSFVEEKRYYPSPAASMMRDDGLLEDIVPFQMRNKPKEE